MKFVLFLIKTLSLILCAGLFGAYLYWTFLVKEPSQFMANASLLLFVLSVVITSLTVVLTENKVKSNSNNSSGLDAYLAELRKEEKNATKQIQKALPENLVPMLEKVVASISESRDGIDRVVLDSKTAFSAALSENKTALSGILGNNQNAINDTISENIRLLEARLSESQKGFVAKIENLLEQTSSMSAKSLPPLNLALENINTRLDDLENKIISNRMNFDAVKSDFEAQKTNENMSAELTADATASSAPAETTEPAAYDFSDFTNLPEEPVAELTTEATATSAPAETTEPVAYDFSDFTNLPEEPVADLVPEETATPEPISDFNDFTNLPDEPVADLVPEETATPEPVAETDKEPELKELNNNIEDADNYKQFTDDLSELADLEIMQEPVAPTAEPKFDEIDIDEFLKGRTDLKN